MFVNGNYLDESYGTEFKRTIINFKEFKEFKENIKKQLDEIKEKEFEGNK